LDQRPIEFQDSEFRKAEHNDEGGISVQINESFGNNATSEYVDVPITGSKKKKKVKVRKADKNDRNLESPLMFMKPKE
jgi:hypothetical protein